MKEVCVPAQINKFDDLLLVLDHELERAGCPRKVIMQMDIAFEEMYVNVAHYAYPEENISGEGKVKIKFDVSESDKSVTITLDDEGKEFDPLAKPDPDVTLSADERAIGGLGIYMVKKSMDKVSYERKDGHNIFIMTKGW